jgi:signal peptidase I
MSKWLHFATSVALMTPVIVTATDYIGFVARVEGSSMQPTIRSGDVVVVRREWFGPPARGDVVMLHSPVDPAKNLIKRVVAIEEDVVSLPNGAAMQIPRGQIWVEGDNSSASLDSRHYGPVSASLIIGHAVAVANTMSPL